VRMRKFEEVMAYGKRSERIAYVLDPSLLPPARTGMTWREDAAFRETSESASFHQVREEVRRKGFAIAAKSNT